MTRFSDDELRRYGRQMLLREVGGRGQERLRAARLHLRAAGAAGAVAADYLARAGVQLTVEAAPSGPSLLFGEGGALLFGACAGPLGEVGPGCACGASAVLREGSGDGAAAFVTGSALGLEALKRLLGLPEALAARPGEPRDLLRVDLLSTDGPAIERRAAPACACAAAGTSDDARPSGGP